MDNQQHTSGQFLEDAIRIARKAGAALKHRLKTDFSVEFKGEVDLVTEMDRAAQNIIQEEILAKYPLHGILAEEDLDEQGTDGHIWIVDPLDGTTNYAHGFPVFSVSIAVSLHGDTLCGVVHNPMSEETFTAIKNEGASLNGHPITVSSTDKLDKSLLGTGFPYNIRETADNNLEHFSRLAVTAQGIRRCGSAALDLCFVACGRFDGFWELGLKPWDVAAGILIVKEAGGTVTDFEHNPVTLDGSRILASNGLIHSEISGTLRSAGPGEGQD
jgi:myo-inositol-1(or 4)-monophosphatase